MTLKERLSLKLEQMRDDFWTWIAYVADQAEHRVSPHVDYIDAPHDDLDHIDYTYDDPSWDHHHHDCAFDPDHDIDPHGHHYFEDYNTDDPYFGDEHGLHVDI